MGIPGLSTANFWKLGERYHEEPLQITGSLKLGTHKPPNVCVHTYPHERVKGREKRERERKRERETETERERERETERERESARAS